MNGYKAQMSGAADPNRCERAFVGNTLGMVRLVMICCWSHFQVHCVVSALKLFLHVQANAVSDKLLDLRSCVYTGKNLADKVLAGALVADADFSNTVMSNVTMTKSYAKGTNFSGMQAEPLFVLPLNKYQHILVEATLTVVVDLQVLT